jgi:hypothetical protein
MRKVCPRPLRGLCEVTSCLLIAYVGTFLQQQNFSTDTLSRSKTGRQNGQLIHNWCVNSPCADMRLNKSAGINSLPRGDCLSDKLESLWRLRHMSARGDGTTVACRLLPLIVMELLSNRTGHRWELKSTDMRKAPRKRRYENTSQFDIHCSRFQRK